MAQPPSPSPSPQMCILVCYPAAVEIVVVLEWQLNFAHWDVGRIPVVVAEFAGVSSFCSAFSAYRLASNHNFRFQSAQTTKVSSKVVVINFDVPQFFY